MSTHATLESATPRLLFTAPWEPVVVRRGDALGLRAFADHLADAVAPGMSNRVNDGRWITILSWCLARSHEVFHATGARSVASRREQQRRYAWLRPLELMWVARTIALADNWGERSLAGRRRVRPWLQENEMQTDRFGMSTDQFRAYRQTGMYGGYRIAFRKWARMTLGGDGWTPGSGTTELARWLDGRLGPSRPPWPLNEADEHKDSPLLRRAPRLDLGDEHKWWLRHWIDFREPASKGQDERTLPRPRGEYEALPEREHIEAVAFAADAGGTRRRAVAGQVLKASAGDHAEVCEHLARAFTEVPAIRLLPFFTRLADAGVDAMNSIAAELHGERDRLLTDISQARSVRDAMDRLSQEADRWRQARIEDVPHVHTVARFAETVRAASTTDRVRVLLEYHELHGGGLRWFVVRDHRVEPRMRPRAGSARYRFRLWALCRLAVQSGVLRRMPRSILDDASAGGDGEDVDD